MAPTKLELRIPERVVHPPVDAPEEEVIAEVGEALAVAASSNRPPILDEDARRAARRAAVDLATAALTANSAETASHSDDVDIIAEGIGRRLGLSDQQLDDVMVAARLHDIGKLGVPQSIIEKPAALDASEWAVIKRHTIIGEQILLAVPELRSAARLVRHSHERWDGGGYPDGLSGQQIPIGSRIVFCADAYHAIRSDRAYRSGRSAAEALAEIRSCAGTQFDPTVVDALQDMAVQLRAKSAGRNAAFGRSRRLMALMLVVSVGFSGSAIARSGVIAEARTPPPAAGAAQATTAPSFDPTGGFAAPGQSSGTTGPLAPGQSDPGNFSGSPFSKGTSLLSVMPAELKIPGDPIAGPTAPSPVATEVGSSDSGAVSGGGASVADPSAAKPQTNASGPTHGKAKGKAKQSDDSGASETNASAKGSSESTSGSSSAKSSSSGKSSATATKTAKSGKGSTSTSTSSSSSTTSSSDKGSGKASSGKSKGSSPNGSGATTQTSGSSEGPGTGKAPKPPKPPKPPKVTLTPPPAAVTPPSGAVPGSSGSISGSSSGPGSSGSGSNSGGNGNGNGHGHGHG